MKIRLTCIQGDYENKVVEVLPDEPLCILLEKLNYSDKNYKFVFRSMTYQISSKYTFRQIGIDKDTTIFIFNQALSGWKVNESYKYENKSD